MQGAKQSVVVVAVAAAAVGGGWWKGTVGMEEEAARLYCVCHVKRYCSHTRSNEDHF